MNHIALSGCDDVLSKPFFPDRWDEQLLAEPKWQDFLKMEIGGALTRNPVVVGSVCHIAVPKGRHTFRTVAHMSLCDTLKYTALVFSIGREIESKRLPKNVVFSNRFDARRYVLDRKGYDKFRVESKALSESGRYKIKIITDVANFYDRLNLHKLENILKEIKCELSVVSKLNDILVRWSQQQSFGIPVGTDASRLLAEAMLINADRELADHRIKFIRYVDDYRIFCSSPERAYEAMQVLDAALRREGLFLNSGKTKLVDLELEKDEDEAEDREFERIDLEERIEKTVRVPAGRYSSRIAKYYKYPGKEAISALRKVDLSSLLLEIRKPNASEDRLKFYVKAAIYAENPSFDEIKKVLALYPHLIPYVCDAIVKEMSAEGVLHDLKFQRQAIAHFRAVFRNFPKNDYFRIQAARMLCSADSKCGAFLARELMKVETSREVLFSQIVYMAKDKIPRSAFIEMISKYSSYGYVARTSLLFILMEGLILKDEEQRAQIRHLRKVEVDGFLNQLLKS